MFEKILKWASKSKFVFGLTAIMVIVALTLSVSFVKAQNNNDDNIVDQIILLFMKFKVAEQEPIAGETMGAVGNMLAEDYLPYVRYNDGYYSDKTVSAEQLTSTDDLTVADDAVIGGQLSALEGLAGEVLATSSSVATGVLTEADFLAYNYIKLTSNVSATFALTLPATSTMTTLIPNAGDYKDICIENATSSTMALTITAGSGIRLVASTNAMDVIDETEISCIRFIRENDTDVLGVMTDELVDVD